MDQTKGRLKDRVSGALEGHSTYASAVLPARQSPLAVSLRDAILRMLKDDDYGVEEIVANFRPTFTPGEVKKVIDTLALRGEVDLITETAWHGPSVTVCLPLRDLEDAE
jgi:hypothetical protein